VARRGARGVSGGTRADGIALAIALVLSVIALTLPEPRSDSLAGMLRRTALAPLTSMQRGAERARSAINTRDSAEFASDTNTIRAMRVRVLAEENDRLRTLLGLGSRIQTGFVAAEAMHGPALGEDHTIVLNVGSNAGVVPFSPVISARGVVGYVRSADAASSVAIVWPHPDFRVSAVSADGSAGGIVAAHLKEGPSRYLLEFRGVPFRSPLDSGAVIVSSGVGGTFPAGIVIGTVLRQLDGAEGWERNYLVVPAARASDVESVLVLLPGQSNADFKSIWSNPDLAAQRVVVAGDSIRRLLADSLRRVIGDSIRRAKLDSVREAVSDSLRKAAAARRDTTRRVP
jgi:rod shape-determining protein MreC